MVNVYGSEYPSYAAVTPWFNEIKRGRVRVEDEPRSGRPTTSTVLDNSASADSLFINNR